MANTRQTVSSNVRTRQTTSKHMAKARQIARQTDVEHEARCREIR
jgi:hypothetical protein